MKARQAEISDVKKICDIHRSAFGKELFSTHLKDELLEGFFEALITTNKYCFIVEEEQGNSVYGYIIGGYKTQQAADKFFNAHILSAIIIMIRNPVFILEKISKFLKKFFLKSPDSKAALRLYLIGVENSVNKKGVGSLLLSKFEEELEKDGINQYGLFVHKFNKNAIRFYERRRFEHEFDKDNMRAYLKKIKQADYN